MVRSRRGHARPVLGLCRRRAAPSSVRGTRCTPDGGHTGPKIRLDRIRRLRAPPAGRRAARRPGCRGPEPCDIGAACTRLQPSSGESMSARWAIVIAVRLRWLKHGAFRPPGGSAGVEQPRQRRRVGAGRPHWRSGQSPRVTFCPQGFHWVVAVQLGGDRRGSEDQRDTRVREDLHHLAGMQFVVDRNCHGLRRPNRKQQFNDLRTVLTGDRDPRTRRTVLPERARQAQPAVAQLPPGATAPIALIHRAAIGEALRGLIQQRKQVHRAIHSDVSANSDRYLVELHPPSTTMV